MDTTPKSTETLEVVGGAQQGRSLEVTPKVETGVSETANKEANPSSTGGESTPKKPSDSSTEEEVVSAKGKPSTDAVEKVSDEGITSVDSTDTGRTGFTREIHQKLDGELS